MSQFVDYGCKNSPTFKYWFSFLEASNILRTLLRSERNADFELYLEAVKQTLPFLKAGGQNNYAKYTPVYLLDMKNFENKNPEAYKHLKDGNFVVKRNNLKKFNCIASDMALEQTINKDCKSSGGVVGFTKNEETLCRWLITRRLMGEYSKKVESLIIRSNQSKESYGLSEKMREEEDVKKMLSLIESTWVNPFDRNNFSNDLIHIATGKVASDDVNQSLSNFKEKASSTNKKFAQDRFTINSGVSF